MFHRLGAITAQVQLSSTGETTNPGGCHPHLPWRLVPLIHVRPHTHYVCGLRTPDRCTIVEESLPSP